ncbi:hypothetical protein SAMN04515674_105332 [Pseudarcicella hirudinis]|uniref:Uncharacterized protein n=1 Tax=Pseudarcicella hirudinis TaxID=1079859 RepID=A0A1I5T1W6_9BACT|nr:hypothetical protein [Pseudarcicella hirudinis]SFP77054.1 hypothetical protein SAMN04515674_105332 [Pseudarcicella hirudinis]
MKNLEKISADMRYSGKIKTSWFNPVVSLGIGSNIEILRDIFFETSDEATVVRFLLIRKADIIQNIQM